MSSERHCPNLWLSRTSVLILIAAVGCSFPDEDELYRWCEVPLTDLRCPASDLEQMLPEPFEASAELCEVWLEEPYGGLDVPQRLRVPSTLFKFQRDSSEEPLSCPESSGAVSVKLAPQLVATYGKAVIACPSRRDRCPSAQVDEAHPVCRLTSEAQRLDQGRVISDFVVTDSGPAVLWFTGSRERPEPRITWYSLAENDFEELVTVAPCELEGCDGQPASFEEHHPAQQVAVSGDSLIIAGLCHDDALALVSPDGVCNEYDVGEGEDVVEALSVSERDDGGFEVFWSSGDRVAMDVFSSSEEGLRREASGQILFESTFGARQAPSAVCLSSESETPSCILGWTNQQLDDDQWPPDDETLQFGQVGELMWQQLGVEGGRENSGRLGRGQDVTFIAGPEEDGRVRGLALSRHEELGVVARGWSFPSSGAVRFTDQLLQIGVGGANGGEWTVSPPRGVAIGDGSFIVAWWSATDSGRNELVLTAVVLDEDLGMTTTPVRLGELTTEPVGWLDEPPVLAWGRDSELEAWEQGLLLLSWHPPALNQVFSTAVFTPTATSTPNPPELFELEYIGGAPLNLAGQCDPICGVDTTALDGHFLVAVASSGGVTLQTLAPSGEQVATLVVESDSRLSPSTVSLWSPAPLSESGEVWLVSSAQARQYDEDMMMDVIDAELAAALVAVDDGSLSLLAERASFGRTEGISIAVQPELTGGGPLLTWSEVEKPPYQRIAEIANAGDGYVSVAWPYFEIHSFPRLAQLEGSTDGIELSEIPIGSVSLNGERPTSLISRSIDCPDNPPYEGREVCTYLNYSTTTPEDLDFMSDLYVHEAVPAARSIFASTDAGTTSRWLEFWDTDGSLEVTRRVPLTMVVSDDAVVSVFSQLDPYSPFNDDFHVERTFPDDTEGDLTVVELEWLTSVGALFQNSFQPASVHFARPRNGARDRFGMVWTRIASHDYDILGSLMNEEPPRHDAGRTYSEREIETLFVEVDWEMQPVARAAVLDWEGHWPAISWPEIDYDPEEFLYTLSLGSDIVSPLMNSAAVQVDDGEYLVAWTRMEYEYELSDYVDEWQETMWTPVLAGDAFVGRVRCSTVR